MSSSPQPTSTDSATLLGGVDPAPLYTAFDLAGVELSNRFVMAPMTRSFSPGGIASDDVVEYYRRRAAHLGLIITEGTYIDHPSAGTSTRVPRLYGEESLAGWRRVVDAVHAEGGRIFPQLWHLGLSRREGSGPHPAAPVLSPSGVKPDGAAVGAPASTAEIDAVIASFARAAADAQRIGFDGVELHGAHGYLLDQFLWSATNRRSDRYGGNPAARARVGAEVVAAVRDAVGPAFPVMFRYSQWKGGAFEARIADTPVELESVLAPLVDAGVSGFHVSTRRYWLPGFDGDRRTLAGWTKKITGLPTIALGSVGVAAPFLESEASTSPLSLAPLLDLFERDEFDLVALGRAVLSEPGWPTKVRDGRVDEIRTYDKSHESQLF
ncbi:NADH:flavin oxidoreductase [Microbacterium murale]|uniref:2,4-dienoyl-CoA reductase-like NADH-dependent reductase (Old Yellow Enzyme family) n=1 Tax=Microbacterium murale TaxID=1081040 RepID=A0ABU0PAA8_9MICO|nr:NADH:flavin oxidoreductase [Microbacterium murale]MDQ0644263.1 2,4-dienoyl-CoA reductase-like NADH-dependent reductase (Old Yellow Enzyme family) [Microbacterium murale]